MRALLAACLVLLCACGGAGSGATSAGAEPALTAAAAVAAAEAADDALRSGAAGRPVNLEAVLGGHLLEAEQARLAVRRQRAAWSSETLVDRRAVHVAAGSPAPEAVLFIRVRAGAATNARQWRAILGRSRGRWVVVDAHDLPPPQWWPA